MGTRSGRAFVLIGLLLAGSCGRADVHRTVEPTPAPTVADTAPVLGRVVPAADVELVGSLTPEQQELVDWALGRFDLVDLPLPRRIEVRFEAGPDACGWATGHCRPDRDPPLVRVCTGPGDTFGQLLQQRTILLHELAHVWHWAQGEGEAWPDLSDVVGGCCCDDATVVDTERTEERVATVVAWGLLDQRRRPVPTDVTCAELSEQFLALTGHPPLGPIEPVCVPR